MLTMNWGYVIKRLRQEKGLTQEELSQKAKLARSYIATIETGRYDSYRSTTLAKLAYGLDMPIAEVIIELEGKQTQEPEKAEDLIRKALIVFPDTVPIYDPKEFKLRLSGPVEPSDFIYRRKYPEYQKVIGCYAYGHCLEPEIHDGDILIVDDEIPPKVGDIAVCLIGDQLHTGKINMIDNLLWLINNHGQVELSKCERSWLIIEIRRRLK